MPGICRKRYLLLIEAGKHQPGFTDHLKAVEALQAHIRRCPDCLAFIRSFPVDGPAYPAHEPAEAEPQHII